ncbi:MAG: ABC transporter permease subunit [Candidatus Natronoplasma sp.]
MKMKISRFRITPVSVILLFAPIVIILYLLKIWIGLTLFLAFSTAVIYLLGEKKEEFTFIIFSLLGLLLVVFILLPVSELIYAALPELDRVLSDPKALNSIFISLTAALSATFIGLLFGIPLSYVLARRDFPGKSFVEGMIDLPMVVPHTVAGIALLVVFGRHGSVGSPLNAAGINFVDAFPGIVVAMLFVSIPFIVNQVREGFEDVDPRLEQVAMSLGADRKKTFLTISFPLVKRNIVSGGVMAWARAISEFGAVVVIAYFPMSAPVYIYETFLQKGLFAARPIAALLLLITLSIFITLRTITRRFSLYDRD